MCIPVNTIGAHVIINIINMIAKRIKKAINVPSWRQVTLPSRITLFAGIISVVYAPLVMFLKGSSQHVALTYQFIVSTGIAFIITLAVALQVNCMLTGGCLLAAWGGAVTAAIAAYLYIRYVDDSFAKGDLLDTTTVPNHLRIDNTTPYIQLNSLLAAEKRS